MHVELQTWSRVHIDTNESDLVAEDFGVRVASARNISAAYGTSRTKDRCAQTRFYEQ